MNEPALWGMIGLARRAGRMQIGRTAVKQALARKKALVVLLDEQASENTRAEMTDVCLGAGVPMLILPAGGLEKLLGEGRKCACVTDANFASRITQLYET
ncbi:MAG: hypothetical protein II912_02835 [Clostridia bacterium]|nr:hypothetical protein [Clostridia bacterium]